MREYYIKGVRSFAIDYKYLFGSEDDLLPEITVGDIHDDSYSVKLDCKGVYRLNKESKVYGFRARKLTSLARFSGYSQFVYSFVQYKPEFAMLEPYIISWQYTDKELEMGRWFKFIRVSELEFKQFKWFNTSRSFVDMGERIPISIADYIINYAESSDFADDLSYVYCPIQDDGVVVYRLSPDCKPLLAKLRLLR